MIKLGLFGAISAVVMLLFWIVSYYTNPYMWKYSPPLQSNSITWVLVAYVVFWFVYIVIGLCLKKRELRILARVRGLLKGEGVSPREFLSARDALLRNGDFTGIYVIHNTTKDMNYVGQSVRVVGRVTQHFTGHGNGDVYADYKYGDDFTINVVSLYESGYESLDALERDAIRAYAAYDCGYNRTRGNGSYPSWFSVMPTRDSRLRS